MRPKVYIETTIPSYLTAWPSRDLVRAAHQQITREWWADARERFDLFTSRIVLEECEAGDPRAAADRLAAMTGIPLLDVTASSEELAEALVNGASLPKRAEVDAFHIAIAAIHGMDYLLTWNCTHIANPAFRPMIESVCREYGHVAPLVGTPDQMPIRS